MRRSPTVEQSRLRGQPGAPLRAPRPAPSALPPRARSVGEARGWPPGVLRRWRLVPAPCPGRSQVRGPLPPPCRAPLLIVFPHGQQYAQHLRQPRNPGPTGRAGEIRPDSPVYRIAPDDDVVAADDVDARPNRSCRAAPIRWAHVDRFLGRPVRPSANCPAAGRPIRCLRPSPRPSGLSGSRACRTGPTRCSPPSRVTGTNAWTSSNGPVRRSGRYGSRVSLVLKADIRPGHTGEITGKLARVEAGLAAAAPRPGGDAGPIRRRRDRPDPDRCLRLDLPALAVRLLPAGSGAATRTGVRVTGVRRAGDQRLVLLAATAEQLPALAGRHARRFCLRGQGQPLHHPS